jgi:hypothetical protein
MSKNHGADPESLQYLRYLCTVYICGRLRLRRRARQCLFAAAHVSRNSDDERGSLSRCSVSGTCAAALLPYQLPRWGSDWAAVTARSPCCSTRAWILLLGFWPCLSRTAAQHTQHTVASCCSCAGPFGKRGGAGIHQQSQSALHTAAGSRPTQIYQLRQRLWSPAQLQYHDRY